MPTHAEKRVLPYTSEQMFDLVVDVERYPEFLPWCLAVRIRHREPNLIVNEMMIGFRLVRERFASRVVLDRPHRIDVSYAEGPFRYLNNHWLFRPVGDDACEIDFYVDFEFHSRVLQRLMEVLFGEAVRRMVRAFESRAAQLYHVPDATTEERPS
jgi:coenzyme Q-binding protein COQ10